MTVTAWYRRGGKTLSTEVYGYDTREALANAWALPAVFMVMPAKAFA